MYAGLLKMCFPFCTYIVLTYDLHLRVRFSEKKLFRIISDEGKFNLNNLIKRIDSVSLSVFMNITTLMSHIYRA